MSIIPKIIHQIYWDFSEENKPPKEEWQRSSQELRQKHPKWKYYCWNLEQATDLIEEEYPYLLNKWESFSNIEKCDTLRAVLMYHYGGVYCDMDIKCVKPFDDLLDKGDVILAEASYSSFLIKPVINSVMLSKPKMEFWKLFMDRINQVWIPKILPTVFRIFYLAGPLALSLHYTSYQDMVELYPSEYFDVKSEEEITENTYVIHYGNTSWNNDENRNEGYDFVILLILYIIFIVLLVLALFLWYFNYI